MKKGLHISIIAIALVVATTAVYADMIEIRNESDERCYCAVYYVKDKNAWRVSNVTPVAAGKNALMNRPPFKWRHDRELVCRSKIDELTESATKDQLKGWDSQNIGTTRGSTFHMQLTGDIWRGFNDANWKTRKVAGRVTREVKELGVVAAGEAAELRNRFAGGVREIKEGQVLAGSRHIASGVAKASAAPFKAVYTVAAHEVKKAFGQTHPALRNRRDQYAKKKASVRRGNQLCDEERRALELRLAHVGRTIERQLNPEKPVSTDQVPRIAIVASGGGYRAMILTLGWLAGAQREGLLDMASWLVGLSGSTWAMSTWLSGGHDTVWNARDQLFERIAGKHIVPTKNEVTGIVEACAVPLLQDQPFTLVQMYGALLANRLLSKFDRDRHRVYLSDQAARVATGSVPIPIYTAVSAHDGKTQGWMEFTPWEVGGTWLASDGAYIPTWAYGRRFWNGTSADFNLEKDLGFQMGTFGSAFAISLGEAYDHIDGVGPKALDKLLRATVVRELKSIRATEAQVPNFTFGLNGAALKGKKDMSLVDAGIVFNLPYPPVSGKRKARTPDIVIFLDASGGTIGTTLCKVADYAREHNLPFPEVTPNDCDIADDCQTLNDKGLSRKERYDKVCSVGKDAVTILRSKNGGPTVIYVPRVNDPSVWPQLDNSGDPSQPNELREYAPLVRDCNQCAECKHCDPIRGGFDIEECTNDGACGTAKFEYDAGMLKQLSGMAEFQMRAIAKPIFDEIKRFMIRKSGGTVQFNEPPPMVSK